MAEFALKNVGIVLLVGIVEHGCPYFVGVVLLQDAYVVLVVVVHIEVSGVEITVLQHHQNAFVALILADELASSVVVKAEHIAVEPHFASAQRRAAPLLQGDAVHRVTGQDVAHGLPSLDVHQAEVLLEDDATDARVGFQGHFDDFGLTVGVGTEVYDA